MTRGHAPGPSLSAIRFPQLESFFSGYLHEDYVADHGSPEGALRAWRLDATPKESQQLDDEACQLLQAADALPFEQVAAFIRRDLGSAWKPSDLARLKQLFGPVAPRVPR
jgi:hypothetical protein